MARAPKDEITECDQVPHSDLDKNGELSQQKWVDGLESLALPGMAQKMFRECFDLIHAMVSLVELQNQ